MPEAMDRTAKLALVERFMDATNTGRLDLLDECVAADYVQHNPWAGQGLSGVREYFARMLESFPDLNARLDAFITEDDLIATRFTVTGTHRGAFAGHPVAIEDVGDEDGDASSRLS
jgi:predicted ester cyclase